ncbi:DUF3616 domain-containing protein [Massilia glaciei]|uniref:DUF3616 domain-containing protein n=1 Tax=Massilia glaciei TaxID=1524097 RepID=A0A2U2I6L4_9BURK|nr:DUF3616 domain-containing protein [Massilia glaciei]PWF55401.1 DUF3616 domain-containing protein [Massilia glaciei]
MTKKSVLPSAIPALLAGLPHARPGELFVYRGMADASAAAALGPELFVVADDERNRLLVYRRGRADAIGGLDLSGFLGTAPDKESDLEGAAAVGARIYWISSHGRTSKGKTDERRQRFFATEGAGPGDGGAGAGLLAPVGKPYANLLADLVAAPQLRRYDLAQAAARDPESAGAFNIEGLAATPEGGLLIGLRNPAPRGMALLVELLNPAEVVGGAGARLGRVVELDLGGRAVRSIELVGLAYMIIAGPSGKDGDFALFQWSGDNAEPARMLHRIDVEGAHPEALFAIPGTRMVQILSDDGGGDKKLAKSGQRFRGIVVAL